MGKWIMFNFIDKYTAPLAGYRTIFAGYAATTLPAVIEIATSDLDGAQFWFEIVKVAAGPIIHYFRTKAKLS